MPRQFKQCLFNYLTGTSIVSHSKLCTYVLYSIRESGDALTASCQSTAAVVPDLVAAINNTAATAPKEDDKEVFLFIYIL